MPKTAILLDIDRRVQSEEPSLDPVSYPFSKLILLYMLIQFQCGIMGRKITQRCKKTDET
jgi:hypothetical protein